MVHVQLDAVASLDRVALVQIVSTGNIPADVPF